MKLDTKAQVTIWVVVGIFLVASILLFFFIEQRANIPRVGEASGVFEVESFMQGCVRQSVSDAVSIMLPQGGFLSPNHSAYFNNTEIEYLCYNQGSYEPCIHQHPMLLNEMKREIATYVTPKVEECFDEMRREFERRGSDIELGDTQNIAVSFAQDKIFLDVTRGVSISAPTGNESFDSIHLEVASPAYNLASIAVEITAQESEFCYFEANGYGILYPRYEINKYSMSAPTRIYTIKDRKSGEIMNIAIRGCAIPPGV